MKKILFLILIVFCSAFTDAQMKEGHSVYVTQNADETQEWKLRLIQSANHSLEISAGYGLGRVFGEVLQAVRFKLEENPKIKIHLMAVQITGAGFSESNFAELHYMKQHFPDRFDYLITEESDIINIGDKVYVNENHTKLIIADEKYFLLGGTNTVDTLSTADPNKYPVSDSLTERLMQKAASDMDTVISGPMAEKLRKEFFRLYSFFETKQNLEPTYGEYLPQKTRYFSIASTGKARIAFFEDHPYTFRSARVFGVISGPRIQHHTIGNMYEAIIDKSIHSIDIGNMYFFPRESIYNALLRAINRNVSFNLVTNGPHEGPTQHNALRGSYGYINRVSYFPILSGRQFKAWELFEAKDTKQKNASVYELNLPEVLLHKKVMAVDNRYAIIGSYNLGMKSEDAAFEVAVAIESQETAYRVQTILMDDYANSTKIPYNQAMGWYFDPYYAILESFERKFFDGILL